MSENKNQAQTSQKNTENTPANQAPANQAPASQAPATQAADNAPAKPVRNTKLHTSHGTTTIEDVVVSKIAGLAAREVSGVHALGGNAARMVGAIRESFVGQNTNIQQGVSVEVGESQAAVDVAIVAEYGVAIHELAEAIRRNIINSIERMTGLEVTEVNVTVHDVHLDLGDDDDDAQAAIEQPTQSRVQ